MHKIAKSSRDKFLYKDLSINLFVINYAIAYCLTISFIRQNSYLWEVLIVMSTMHAYQRLIFRASISSVLFDFSETVIRVTENFVDS